MRIKRTELNDIINEAVDEVFKELKEEEKKNCNVGSPFHGKDGTFVSPEDEAGSWSVSKGGRSGKDCKHGQKQRPTASKKTGADKEPCGRKAPAKCKGNLEEEESSATLTQEMLEKMVEEVMYEAQRTGAIR